jgi:hypothetical protein
MIKDEIADWLFGVAQPDLSRSACSQIAQIFRANDLDTVSLAKTISKREFLKCITCKPCLLFVVSFSMRATPYIRALAKALGFQDSLDEIIQAWDENKAKMEEDQRKKEAEERQIKLKEEDRKIKEEDRKIKEEDRKIQEGQIMLLQLTSKIKSKQSIGLVNITESTTNYREYYCTLNSKIVNFELLMLPQLSQSEYPPASSFVCSNKWTGNKETPIQIDLWNEFLAKFTTNNENKQTNIPYIIALTYQKYWLHSKAPDVSVFSKRGAAVSAVNMDEDIDFEYIGQSVPRLSPSECLFVIDVKPGRTHSDTFIDGFKGQVFHYCELLLEDFPQRPFAIGALTNSSEWQFFWVKKSPDLSTLEYYETKSMSQENGYDCFLRLLTAPFAFFGLQTDSCQNSPIDLGDLVGIGTSCSVYEAIWCQRRVAAKVFKPNMQKFLPKEALTLQKLKRMSGVVQFLGIGQFTLLMEPLCSPVVIVTEKIIDGLVSTLRDVHLTHKFVHRDLSPSHIQQHGNAPVIIDWGSAVELNFGGPFSGTVHFASKDVYSQFKQSRGSVSVLPKDDLESLVKSIFYLNTKFRKSIIDNATLEDCHNILWPSYLEQTVFAPCLNHARNGEYALLSFSLQNAVSKYVDTS